MSIVQPIDRKERKAQQTAAMECRATRHWMQRQAGPPGGWRRPDTPLWSGAWRLIVYECQRCGTWRYIAIDHMGRLLASKYEPPDWYRRNGEGRLSGEELRLWQVGMTARDRRAAKR